MTSIKEQLLEKRRNKKKLSKAQLQLAIIKKKQCDGRALKIVEQLIEPNVDSNWLLENLRHINKSHMEDVIEERAIIKLCGYVLCQKPLTQKFTQQYCISTKKNKVYDITKRKNFCSPYCYGACSYLLEQMLTSPLWLRDQEEIPVFHFLPSNHATERSIPGDEVYMGEINVMLDKDDNSRTISNESMTERGAASLSNLNETVESDLKHTPLSDEHDANEITQGEHEMNALDTGLKEETEKSTIQKNVRTNNICQDLCKAERNLSKNDMEVENEDPTIGATTAVTASENYTISNRERNCTNNKHLYQVRQPVDDGTFQDLNSKQIKNSEEVDNENHKTSTHFKDKRNKQNRCQANSKQSCQFYSLAAHIEQCVKEWITQDTLSLLSGDDNAKSRLLDSLTHYNNYLQLHKKLNKLQLEDERKDSANLETTVLKPLPYWSDLQEEGKKMDLKVQAFYEGSMVIERSQVNEKVEDNESSPILPLTDAHAPKALRRKILLDKLHRTLPDLIRALTNDTQSQINVQYIYSTTNSLTKLLVSTFSLSASNIIFNSAEWILLGLIIIKMLSAIDPEMKCMLGSKQASMYVSMILMSYKLDSNYLDRLLIDLSNKTL